MVWINIRDRGMLFLFKKMNGKRFIGQSFWIVSEYVENFERFFTITTKRMQNVFLENYR